jgi:hypothetical protein
MELRWLREYGTSTKPDVLQVWVPNQIDGQWVDVPVVVKQPTQAGLPAGWRVAGPTKRPA